MCQTCFDRGYYDYPKFIGSAKHMEDYQRGFNQHQREDGGSAECVSETDFCEKCFSRGKRDYHAGIYTPPTTKRGHKESYDEGYYYKEAKLEEEKIQKLKEQEEFERRRKLNQNKYQEPKQDSTLNDFLAKILGGAILIAGLIWLAFNVAIPLLIINLSIISLILGLFFKKDWRILTFLISVFGAVLLIFDYKNGWFTRTLVQSVTFFEKLIVFFLIINVAAGLISLYFLIDQYYIKAKRNTSPIKPKDDKIETSKGNFIIESNQVQSVSIKKKFNFKLFVILLSSTLIVLLISFLFYYSKIYTKNQNESSPNYNLYKNQVINSLDNYYSGINTHLFKPDIYFAPIVEEYCSLHYVTPTDIKHYIDKFYYTQYPNAVLTMDNHSPYVEKTKEGYYKVEFIELRNSIKNLGSKNKRGKNKIRVIMNMNYKIISFVILQSIY